ncbi:nucleotide-binding universal stress UspA family protein [Arthrobacter sp. SLBN-100]|uniref:universal stress protein n=1 Tax=Arthrobacter sp. SLBN-100 TaxID=2768450 RepID=UPI0011516FDB|nr:universal stress protein [Arthrobacter sp. SLBN-100]TQJ66383.1 nucleotide-binding universal stress UspA family protein [Arthrobacter sp. SLBN-100]
MTDFERIIVGIDGSEYSPAPLRLAGRLASALGTRIEVITCLGFSDFYLPAHLPAGYIDSAAELEAIAKRLMEQAIERAFGDARPQHLSTTVRTGSPAKVLVEESKSAQLLVVGRRGRGGLLGQLMGSVSSACVAHAHCPVLVVGQDPEEHGE